jgi:hypothetical protein
MLSRRESEAMSKAQRKFILILRSVAIDSSWKQKRKAKNLVLHRISLSTIEKVSKNSLAILQP